MDAHALARMIDHTILKPEATQAEVDRVIDESLEHRFASVCVASAWVEYVARRLRGSGIRTCATIGFPHGTGHVLAKAEEVSHAIAAGAREVDFVAFLPNLLELNEGKILAEFSVVVSRAHREARSLMTGCVTKAIIETAALAAAHPAGIESMIAMACEACREADVDYIKTSTGFHPAGGATVEHVRLMKKHAGDGLQVKASGGIRDTKTALAMVEAGATRLGCSASVAIVKGVASETSGY